MITLIRRHRWLSLIVFLYLLLGITYSLVVPLGESPDEVDHFFYIHHLTQERRFPLMDGVAENNATMEANQPPLYYLLGAAVTGWIEQPEAADFPLNACYTFDPADNGRKTFYRHSQAEQFPFQGTFLAFYLVRILSVLMGAGTVFLAYRLGRQVYPADERVGLAAAALLAFNPQFIFITASANNDVLTTFLGAAIVTLAVAAVRRPTPYQFALLGIVVGLGLLTKFALLALWPLALLAAVWGGREQRSRGAEEQRSRGDSPTRPLAYSPTRLLAYLPTRLLAYSPTPLLLATLIPVVVAGWWYWRAYQLYGDPLAWAVHLEAKGDQVLRVGSLTAADLLNFVLIHFQSYWLWFGWLKIKAPDWVYLLLALMVGMAVVGLIRLVVHDWLWIRFNDQSPITNHPFPVNYPALLFNILAISAIYASLLRYILTINWSGYQGRLAYAVAAPLAVLLALGLWSLAGPRLLKAAGAALLILATVSIPWLLIPAYPRPAIYQPVLDLPDSWTCSRFAAGLELEGFEMERRARPGEELTITLYGYGLAPVSAAQNMLVQLIGRDGVVIGQSQTEWQWKSGQTLSTMLAVPISPEASPARAVVQVGLLTAEGEWQTAVSPSGRPLPSPISLTTIKVTPATDLLLTPKYPRYADFGRQLSLIGYDAVISETSTVNETAVTLQLYWQTLATMDKDYTIFVHLLDAGGRLLAQHDGQPHSGAYPTSIWDEREGVIDTITLRIPSNISAGPHSLAIGVYDLATLDRLPVWDKAGEFVEDGRLLTPFTWEEMLP